MPAGQEPKEWKDILDPKYKGKIAMDDLRGSGPGGTILSGTELLFGQEFSQQLASPTASTPSSSRPDGGACAV